MSNAPRQRLWAGTMRLTLGLLSAWLLLTLLGPWFARDLNAMRLFGFPLGFWLAAQGALLAFLLIIVIYIFRMERMEARYLAESEVASHPDGEGTAQEVGRST